MLLAGSVGPRVQHVRGGRDAYDRAILGVEQECLGRASPTVDSKEAGARAAHRVPGSWLIGPIVDARPPEVPRSCATFETDVGPDRCAARADRARSEPRAPLLP